jgi:hypothetical protein
LNGKRHFMPYTALSLWSALCYLMTLKQLQS